MPRPARIELENGCYHVMSRGNARQSIFLDDADRDRFLEQLQERLQTYEVLLYAYALMSNHFHLLVRTPRANLSRFMQRLNTSYALYFRYRHGRPGHVFQGRYKALVVDGEEYLQRLSRYIHLNPVRIRRLGRASKQERLAHLRGYRWSSYAGYVREGARQEWVDYALLRPFGRSWKEARRRYRGYLEATVMEDDEVLREAFTQSRHAVGDEGFVERIEAELAARRTGTELDRDIELPRPSVSLERIDEMVASRFGIRAESLYRHGRSAGPAKGVAVELAVRLTELSQREIGFHYGGMSSQAVSMIWRRLREANTNEGALADLQRRLVRSTKRP